MVGAGGGIGQALVAALLDREDIQRVFACSRRPAPAELADAARLTWMVCDNSAAAIGETVASLPGDVDLVRVVICNGILHGEAIRPEKAIERFDPAASLAVLEVNTVLPMQWLSALSARLRDSPGAVVAALSARVGSIGDNHRGGWYSYRAAKAALNMMLKTAAIEYARRAPRVKLIAFHPGTTDTALSAPFQRSVPEGKLFSPEFVATRLLQIMDEAPCDGELAYLDWAGKPVPW